MTHKGDGRETWVLDSGTAESGHAAVGSVVNVPKEASRWLTTGSRRPRWRGSSRSTVMS